MTRKDNQGRDLIGVKKHFDMLSDLHERGVQVSREAFDEKVRRFPLPEWTTVKDVLVLRAGTSRFVGVPRNSKKTAANFEILDLDKVEYVTVLTRAEVRSWLWRASQEE